MKTTFNLTKNIIVFYHENCIDGFASAYVAWKKFKNKAEYIPLSHNNDPESILKNKKVKINNLKDKEVYFIDFCLKKDILEKINKISKKLVVIDHHIGTIDEFSFLKDHLYGEGISGAYLASQYFFGKQTIPKLIRYISIGDNWSFSKDKNKRQEEENILSYINSIDFDFNTFRKIEKDFEDKKKFLEIKKIGEILEKNYQKRVLDHVADAKLIDFDIYKVYAVNSSRMFKSELGHVLAEKTKSFAIVYYFEKGELKLSFRGVGKINLSELAQKYGGGGHFNASSMKTKDPKFIEEFIKKIIG
jgi:oligoribonuclease NrnB/cAMP/cGMP phosphodiesterase (DHH superfamily)